jgi:hypothetical protein
MRKWIGILLIVLVACFAAQVPVGYVHAEGCGDNPCGPDK